jgi:hypothetical protein
VHHATRRSLKTNGGTEESQRAHGELPPWLICLGVIALYMLFFGLLFYKVTSGNFAEL